MTEQIDVRVHAIGPASAVAEAKRWAQAERKLRLRTVCKVKQPDPSMDVWVVTLAVTWRAA